MTMVIINFIIGEPENILKVILKKLGQVFLTENNMMVAVIAVYDVKFNHRHEYTPLQRFTSEYVDKDLIIGLKKELNA